MKKKFVVVPQNSVVNIEVKVKWSVEKLPVGTFCLLPSKRTMQGRESFTAKEKDCDLQEFDTEWGTYVYRSFSIGPHRPSRCMLTLFCIVPEKAPGSCGHLSPDPPEQPRPGSGPYFESLDIVGPAKVCLRILRTKSTVYHPWDCIWANLVHPAMEASGSLNLSTHVAVVQACFVGGTGKLRIMDVPNAIHGSRSSETRTRRYLTIELINYYIRLCRRRGKPASGHATSLWRYVRRELFSTAEGSGE